MKTLVSPCVCATLCLLVAHPSAGHADTTYPITITQFYCQPTLNSTCVQPGTVSVNGTVYSANATVNLLAGSTVKLVATPGSGFVFTGWSGLTGDSSQSPTVTLTVNGPLTLSPQFDPASTVNISIMTQPPGLQIMVDGAVLPTPATPSWGWFTSHTLSVVSPQQDAKGNWWVFYGWSDGGAPAHTVNVRAGSWPDTFTARFKPATPVQFISHPPGLHVTIDGTTDCAQCTVYWGAAETHTVTAPAQQTDPAGLSYRFRAWSDGNAGPARLTVPDPLPNAMQVVGMFDRLGLVTIDSFPQGIIMSVDNSTCGTPCQIQRPLGTAVAVKAPAQWVTGYGTRQDFLRWSDDGGVSRTVTAGLNATALVASFRSMRQMIAVSDPDQGAKITVDPPSTDGFYDVNSQVTVTLTPQPGYRFDHWEGDLGGSSPSGWLSMGGPHEVVARMHPIPYLPPHGVRNAATETHGSKVTACSIVAISGINLSTGSEAVGNRPPRILLAGTSVHMGDNYLPLYTVTPGQITAQLPCGLSEGQNTLTVRSGNEPEVTTDFTVVRSAPGLFATRVAGQDYAVAVHADGSAATQDSPAVTGETVTVYGTGFGPLLTPAPEGMVTPVAPEFQLADPIQVLLGGTLVDPAYAGAAGLGTGMDGVRIQIGASGQNAMLKVTINGQDSNSVMLPIGQ